MAKPEKLTNNNEPVAVSYVKMRQIGEEADWPKEVQDADKCSLAAAVPAGVPPAAVPGEDAKRAGSGEVPSSEDGGEKVPPATTPPATTPPATTPPASVSSDAWQTSPAAGARSGSISIPLPWRSLMIAVAVFFAPV